MIQQNTGRLPAFESRPAHFASAVFLACDEVGLPAAVFVASQIIEKETNRDFDVVVCIENREAIPLRLMKSEIRFCEFQMATDLAGLPFSAAISLGAYFWLPAAALLSHEYERLLYLDNDVYLRRPAISALFNAPMTKPVAAAPDISALARKKWLKARKWEDYLRLLGLPSGFILRNSGIVLIDAALAEASNALDRILEFARQNSEILRQHDQSALNGALKKEIGLLSLTWNFQALAGLEKKIGEVDPAIVHFISRPKPWSTGPDGFRSEYRAEYDAFFDKAGFPIHEERSAPHERNKFDLYLRSISRYARSPLRTWRRNRYWKPLDGLIDEAKLVAFLDRPDEL